MGCHENLGPADRSFRRTTRAASADSEVRPGPRPPTLTPHQVKATEAGPEALPTSSLPTLRVEPRFWIAFARERDRLPHLYRVGARPVRRALLQLPAPLTAGFPGKIRHLSGGRGRIEVHATKLGGHAPKLT